MIVSKNLAVVLTITLALTLEEQVANAMNNGEESAQYERLNSAPGLEKPNDDFLEKIEPPRMGASPVTDASLSDPLREQPRVDSVEPPSEFQSLKTYDLSRWKFEVRKWPQANKCVGFWQRLEAELTGKQLNLLQQKDISEAAKIVRNPDASVLRKLASWLRSRGACSQTNELISYVDGCASLLENGGLSAVVVKEMASPPVTVKIIEGPLVYGGDASKAQSEEIERLRAELARVKEQLAQAQEQLRNQN